MSKKQEAIDHVMTRVVPAIHTLRVAGRVAVPSDREALAAVSGCVTRSGRWRKSKPSDDSAALLWQLVRFHRGNGSLYGFPWFADEGERDRLDTLAIVLLGGESRAANAWQRAMGKGGAA